MRKVATKFLYITKLLNQQDEPTVLVHVEPRSGTVSQVKDEFNDVPMSD